MKNNWRCIILRSISSYIPSISLPTSRQKVVIVSAVVVIGFISSAEAFSGCNGRGVSFLNGTLHDCLQIAGQRGLQANASIASCLDVVRRCCWISNQVEGVNLGLIARDYFQVISRCMSFFPSSSESVFSICAELVAPRFVQRFSGMASDALSGVINRYLSCLQLTPSEETTDFIARCLHAVSAG